LHWRPFDQLAERYDSWFDRHASVFQSEIEALKKVIPKAGDGLEVGVGSGRFSAALGIRIGVKPSMKLRKMAEERGIIVSEGVAESLPFPNESFDYILFCTILCFLRSPLQGLSEVKRVLKPGGSLIIGMIDKMSALGQSYEKREKDNPFYHDAHFYSVDDVITLMNQVGFAPQEIYQTIFSAIEEIKAVDIVKAGYGEGGFVVIRAVDKLYGIEAEIG